MSALRSYQRAALRTEKKLPTVLERLGHAVLGLITEGGEFTTNVKRIAIYGKKLDDLDKDGVALRTHMAEELGDVMWYLAIGADAIGYPLENCIMLGHIDMPKNFEDISFLLVRYTSRLADVVLGSEPFEPYNIATLIGQMMRLVNDAAGALGVAIDDICAANVAKLRERFPDAYTDEAAEARADKRGADARNS